MAKKIVLIKKIVLDENTKILVITTAIALAALILCSTIYNLYAGKVRELRSKIDEEGRRLVIRKDVATIDNLIKEYRTYFYKDISSLVLRDTISALARDTAVDVVSMQPVESEKFVNYTKIFFKVKLDCTYNQLGKFIEKLERLERLTKIDEIIISGRRDYKVGGEERRPREGEVRTGVSLTISAYCLGS